MVFAGSLVLGCTLFWMSWVWWTIFLLPLTNIFVCNLWFDYLWTFLCKMRNMLLTLFYLVTFFTMHVQICASFQALHNISFICAVLALKRVNSLTVFPHLTLRERVWIEYTAELLSSVHLLLCVLLNGTVWFQVDVLMFIPFNNVIHYREQEPLQALCWWESS